ncbi:hypothetical protein A4X13_0g8274, partial [Tilletia indica]
MGKYSNAFLIAIALLAVAPISILAQGPGTLSTMAVLAAPATPTLTGSNEGPELPPSNLTAQPLPQGPSPEMGSAPIQLDMLGNEAIAGIPVPPNFLGISIELSVATEIFGSEPSELNAPFLNYIGSVTARLPPHMGPKIRVGGNSQDTATYNASAVTPVAKTSAHGFNPVNGAPVTPDLQVSSKLFDIMRAIGESLRVEWIYGANMASKDNDFDRPMVKDLTAALADQLKMLMVGNEPDRYAQTGRRNEGYSIAEYLNEWDTATSSLEAEIPTPRFFVGPSVCCAWTTNQVLVQSEMANRFKDRLAAVSAIKYPQSLCSANPPGGHAFYLNHSNTIQFAMYDADAVATSVSLRIPYILVETVRSSDICTKRWAFSTLIITSLCFFAHSSHLFSLSLSLCPSLSSLLLIMSDNNNIVPVPLELAASLRILERLPARDRPGVEAAIRAQYEADQEEAQAQAARAAEEEEERFQAEEAAAEQEAQRQLAAMREQEAHLAAAKNLVDLVKIQDGGPEAKDKGKKVLQNDDLENTLDLLVAIPSQKIRDKIRACDYIDLWHLTAEGMAAATRSKLSGDTTFELGSDGSFKLKDSVTGFKADQDLAMATWVTALGHYVRIMQTEGVADSIVQSMLRLNHIMTTHPDFDRHATAIRLWHQHQRRQWVISASLNSDGQRFNLGKPNPQHFEEIRLRLLEERAERRMFGLQGGANGHGASGSGGPGWGGGGSGGGSGGKRPPPNDPPSPAPRAK